jgi:hypothetical protein
MNNREHGWVDSLEGCRKLCCSLDGRDHLTEENGLIVFGIGSYM